MNLTYVISLQIEEKKWVQRQLPDGESPRVIHASPLPLDAISVSPKVSPERVLERSKQIQDELSALNLHPNQESAVPVETTAIDAGCKLSAHSSTNLLTA